MNNLLIAIAVFVITVVGALFAVPHFIDWNSYRSVFEEEARNVIGREVEVDGDIKLHLLPTPYFRVEKVRIADTSTALTEHFFKTESLSIKLSIGPLLRGVVEANEIEFQRPVLRAALDANGGWNWQSFAKALGSTGYVPANVTLTSVKVAEGVIAFHDSDGVERARLDGLRGELSAPALDGPYRFRGSFTSGGARREIRIGTGLPETDGKVPFRLSLRLLDTGASFLLDARLADLMGKPLVQGDLTMRLPIAGPRPPQGRMPRAAAGADEEPRIDLSEETPLEVKAAVKGDVAGAVFEDLTLTFEQGDQPQTVTGTARAAWRSTVTFDMDLSSRWLDLDRLGGAAEGARPAASVVRLAAWLRDLLPGDGLTRLAVSIDQANLAGEAIGPVRLALARSAGRLEISELRATLPGGSRAEIRGDVSGAADALAFKGRLGLLGASAARFMAWAGGNGAPMAANADGPFDLRANVVVDPTQVAVSDLGGTLAGTMLKGSGSYKWKGRPELKLALEGSKLDARAFIPAQSSLFKLLGDLAGVRQSDGSSSSPGEEGWHALQADLDLQLRAGQLVTAARIYRDFSAAVVMTSGDLKQLLLRLSGDDGYNLELTGKVDGLAGLPKGTVRGHVVAETRDSIAPLAALLGIPAALRLGDSREQAIVPLRLAGALTFGARSSTSADLTVDGEGNGMVVKVSARLDGGAGGWRSSRADVTGSLDAADATRIAALLFPGATPAARVGSPKPGRILLRAGGVPSEGMTTLASVDTAGTALNFRGQVKLADTGNKAEGELEAQSGNATSLAALAGLPPALRADGVPVSARLRLAVDAGSISMDKLSLQLGGSRLSGRVTVSDGGERRRIDASLNTEEITVAMLLSPLLDLRFGAASAAEAALLGRPNPWPDEPFSASVLDAFEGRVQLNSKRLKLDEGLAVEQAKVNLVLQPGRIEAKEIAGVALGGQVKGSLTIEKAPPGVDVRGSLGLDIALEEITGPRPAKAKGPINGRIEFSGRGLSPRAVVSALQGQGSVAFGEATLPGLSPGAIAPAVEAALKAEPSKLAPTLRQTLAAGLDTGDLAVRQLIAALDVADGQVRSRPIVIETSEGRASGVARLDLKALKLDSQWRLEAKPPTAADGAVKPLPPVTVSYRAPLATLGAAELQIDTTVLEQELSARKIEHDMEELERLRRLNEADRLLKVPAPTPVQRPPVGPGGPVPPFGHEVRPSGPG